MQLKALARRTGLLGGLTAAAVVVVTAGGAAALTLPTLSPTTTSSSSTSTATHSNSGNSSSQAGQPTSENDLLCGMYTPAGDRMAGNSNIDHPAGATATGTDYLNPASGNNCESSNGNSSDTFTWTLSHSNVNLGTERGTEHGEFALSRNGSREAGFDGHITEFDLSQLTTQDPWSCPAENREIFYSSGHGYDNCGLPSGPGNFNTHGGAQLGQHYRGNYGTIVYQRTDNNSNNSCPYNNGSGTTYCFEGILEGQTN